MFKRGTTKTKGLRSGSISALSAPSAGSSVRMSASIRPADGFYDIEYQYCVGCGKCARFVR